MPCCQREIQYAPAASNFRNRSRLKYPRSRITSDPGVTGASAASLAAIAVAAGFDQELRQLPGAQLPAHLDLHGRLAAVRLAAAAGEFVGVFVGHGDGRAVTDLDGGEALEQRDRDRVGGDGVLEHVLQARSQEREELGV